MVMNMGIDQFQTAVFYELDVQTFCDGDGDGQGDFTGLTSKLDYICSLGIDVLLLLSWDSAGFDRFVEAAHQNRLKVVVTERIQSADLERPASLLARISGCFEQGTDGIRLDLQTHQIDASAVSSTLQRIRKSIDAQYPDRILLVDIDVPLNRYTSYVGQGQGGHLCFNFPLMTRLYVALKQENVMPIRDLLDEMPDMPAGSQWLTFLRNHHDLSLDTLTDVESAWLREQYGPEPEMNSARGIRRRLSPLLEGHKGKWLILNGILCSLIGTPAIYYGDEIGMGDNIALENPGRTPMQWDDRLNGGFTTAAQLARPVNDDFSYGYTLVNVETQEGQPASYLEATRFLLKVRKAHPELQLGSLELLDMASRAVLGYWRKSGDEWTLCLYNFSSEVQSVSLYFEELRGQGKLIDLFHEGRTWSLNDMVPPVLKMRPFASHWIYVKRA